MAVPLVQEVVAKEPLLNMKQKLILIGLCLLWANGFSQTSIKDVLNKFNDNAVPYITVDELTELKTQPIILDAREPAEYNISHLENAITVGFNDFEISKVASLKIEKDKMIVVYCSVGVRSEIIGKQLLNKGYTSVFNLYGGIFDWVNKDGEIFNNLKEPTSKVHIYSKPWDTYLLKGIKVYE